MGLFDQWEAEDAPAASTPAIPEPTAPVSTPGGLFSQWESESNQPVLEQNQPVTGGLFDRWESEEAQAPTQPAAAGGLPAIKDPWKTAEPEEYTISGQWNRGQAQSRAGELAFKKLEGSITPEEMRELGVMKKFAEKPTKEPGFFEGLLGAAANMAPIMFNAIVEGQEWGLKGASVGMVSGAATSALAGPAAPAVAPVTAATGAASGYAVGTTYGATEYIYRIEAGLAYDEMLDRGIDPEIASYAAVGVGTVNALLEIGQIGLILKTIPGGKKLAAKISNTLTAKLLKDAATRPTVGKAIATGAKKFTGYLVTEVGQEEGQEAAQIIGDRIATHLSNELKGTDVDQYTAKQIKQRLKEVGVESLKAFFVLGAPGSVVKTGMAAVEAKEEGQIYDILTGKPPKTPGAVAERVDANQILEAAAARAEGAIPEGVPPEGGPPAGGAPVAAEPGMTPDDILIEAEERRSIEAEAAETLAPSAGLLTPEEQIRRGQSPAQYGVTNKQPSPIYDAQMVEPERIYEAIPETHKAQIGTTEKQPVAPKKKALTAEEMAELPQAELDKIPTEERARALLGDKATDAQVQRLTQDAEKLKATQTVSDLEVAEEGTDKSPSQADIEADTYDQGKFNWEDFDISIETPKGAMRSGTDQNGKKWSQRMNVDYGKMRGVKGADGEELDIAFRRSKKPDDYENVYIIDQVNPYTGEFDEHKVYVGYGNAKQARLGYLANYETGWKGLGDITTMSVAQFKEFVKKMDPKKPAKGQQTITKEEWLSKPEVRPAKYDKAEYRPGATGKVEKVVNATIEKEYETWAEEQAAEAEKPAPATQKVKRQDIRTTEEKLAIAEEEIRKVRPSLEEGSLQAVTPQGISQRAIKAIADLFDVPALFFDPGNAKVNLNGAYVPAMKGIIINVNAKNPMLSLFGHELNHLMSNEHPEIYKKLRDYLRPLIDMDDYLRWLDGYESTLWNVSIEQANLKYESPTIAQINEIHDKMDRSDAKKEEEYIGYFIGTVFKRAEFWRALAKDSNNLFLRVAEIVTGAIKKWNKRKYKAKYEEEFKFVSDIEEATKVIADAYREMLDIRSPELEANLEIQAEIDEFIAEELMPDVEEYEVVKAPKKTRTVYKLFRTLKTRPGELFPLFIGKSESVAIGKWLEAKFIPTKGFAQRPGWHAGVMPIAGHLMKKDGTMADDRVWAEAEVPADVDWQKKADANKSGDIKNEIPKGGHYRFARTKFQGTEWVIAGAIKINKILTQKEVDAINKTGGIEADIEVSETDDANTIALNAISGLADGKTTITIDDKKVGARPIIESIGFVRQGKSNKYKFDERIPKDADIIAGMYQAAWHVDLKTKGTTKELFGQITKRLGRIQREGLGQKEQSDDQKKLRNYLNESRLTYREAAEATDRGNQLPTKNVLVRPKGVESGKGRQLLVQISSDFRAEEASHIGDPYYEALYEKRQGYNRPSRDFWELPEWMTRLAYFMPESDVYVIRSLEEAKAFFNQAEYDNIFFSVLDTNKRFVKDIAQNYKGDIIAGGYLPDGSYYKGLKNVSWMGNMEEAAKKVGVPFKNGVDYRHFKNSKTIPRLEMSRGCLHKCAFCSQERTLKMATPAEIDSQIKEFKAFDYELVYLNDKTFGQAENYTQLIEIKEKLQKANPKFKGFIIQTTAGQFLKMPTDFLNESGIIFVELGVETFNDKFLRSLKKPHTTKLIEQATKKIRDLNMVFVPNVMVGLTGKNKDGSRWVETKETYANTMAFFKKNQDIISHFNIGVLAAETGTELQKQLDDWQEVDTDEATMNRSWLKNKDVHEKYYYDLSKMGLEQLDDTNVAGYVEDATIFAHGKLPVEDAEVLFDIEIDETNEKEGKKGSATGGLLYWNISKIAKDAGGWNKIGTYLESIKAWNGIPITSKSINYIGNKGTELSKDAKLRNKVKAVETFRDRLSAGEIDENSKEYAAAVKKYGADLQLFTVSRSKRFYVGTDTIYGPKQKGDITKTVKKEHSFLGPFKTELTRDKNFKLVMDTPIFSKNLETRRKEIDAIIKKNKQYAGWYEDWNSFIKAFKNLPEDKLIKYIKLMAVFSAQSGPQGNMKEFTRFVNKLEVGQEIKVGKKKDGGDGIYQEQYDKMMAIWNDADPATTLEERQDIYGPKVGTYMHVGLFPHADGVVIDRHMPRLWGYDITWSPNMKFKNFNIMPQVELEIVRDIKEAAARNNISPSAVQATLWYESRIPDVVASSYRMAAAMSPSEYLPGVMHAGLRTESLGVGKHFKQTPLKKGDFLLATKRDGTIKHNSYSRDDIGKRIADHTDENPYAELVYLYEAGTEPELQLRGKPNVYTVDLNQERIYDGIADTLGYWEFARQRLQLDPFANLTNIFANLIKQTGLFDGMVVKAPVGQGRWILLFDKAEITGVPEDIVTGMSDVVETLEKNFPQTVKEISIIFKGRSEQLYKKFRSLKKKYAEIKEEYFKPTVARFEGATQGKHEISGMAGMRGPLKAARAMMAEFGIANIQNNVILIHTEEGAERNGNFYRFKVKRDFESIEDIYKKIAAYGLEEYNISVSQTSGSFFIEQFVLDSADAAFVKNFVKMINEITDKNFPQNITYRATSEVLGDPNWTGVPAKALKYYRKNLVDYFGKKEGNERYVKAIKEAQIYKRKISEQIDPGAALFDIEEGGEGRRQDYGRAVEGQDVIGQFAKPGETMFDIEDATPGETMPDLWYSQLRRMVDSKKFPEKSSPKNMINIVESMARKGEVKQTELDWVGLTDWLDSIKGPVTKRQILEFLDKNNVKLEETVLGGSLLDTEAGRRLIADSLLDLWEQESETVGDDTWDELAEELEIWVARGTRDDLFDIPILIDLFNGDRRLGEWVDEVSMENTETEYAQYTIDEEGSPEYREILISMKEPDLTAGALEALDWYENEVPDAFPAMTKGMSQEDQMRYKLSKLAKLALYKLQKEGAPAYLVRQFKKWQNSPSFEIPHWPSKAPGDVVAHLRFDAKEIDGKHTMFIEEIQSDWAQRGRKQGFIDYTKYAPVGYHFVKQLQPDKTYVVHQLVEDSTGKVLAEGSMRDEVLVKAGFKSGFIKNMPFRLSKDWALVVLKRAVRYAAENGYEQIAWTGGQIQADRYSNAFKKAVDVLYYNRKTGLLRGYKTKYEGEYTEIFSQTIKDDSQLAEYIGEQNAQMMLATKSYNASGRVTEKRYQKEFYGDSLVEDGDVSLHGNNFVFNDQGIKAFYDEIVPSVFKRFFAKKKWGKPELRKGKIESEVAPTVEYIYASENFRIGELYFTPLTAARKFLKNGVKYPHVNALVSKIDPMYIDGLTRGDVVSALSIINLGEFNTLREYGYRNADGFYLFLKNALSQEVVDEKTSAGDMWVSPVTSEMKKKAVDEGFPMFDIEEDSIPAKTGAVLKDKIGRQKKKLSDKIAEATDDFSKNWRTRMLDSLRPIADWFGEDSGAYMSHRGLPGVQSTLNAFMEHGKLQMLDDGSITTEGSGQGFLKWLNGLGQDAEKFLYWQIAKRSEVLTGEDRELLLTDSDRQKIYDWVGESPKSRDSWQEISDEFAEWNQNMLDLAVKAGLLTKEQIGTWQSDFYIPFYRIFEDEQARMEFVKGPAKNKKYISAQVKRLRGSESRIGDPMENIIKNWSALLGNSMFNNARREAFNYANDNNLMSGFTRINEETGEEEEVPVIEQIPWSKTVIFKPMKGGLTFIQEKTGEQVLAFKDGGKSVFFKVNDPELFGALAGINKEYFDNILMKVMSGSKRLLTLGATVTPAFRIANMLRDTLHTFQISDNFIPFWDTARGFIKIWKNDPEYAKFMASGHAFGGSYVRAEDPRAMKRYTDRIVKREGKGALSRILDTAEKMWAFWEAVGEASENAARVQLYINLKQKGKTHQQAAFSARDLMDFQMSGASGIVQFFIQTVPFLNARMQGLYKMGRSAALNPKAFLTKGALISAASLALWLLYWDDDRYKELEDWEKFQYYHFWIGDKHFRIPKPFETGVIFSSSIESAANVTSGNDEISHVFNYLKHALLETFAFNPVPQVIRPATEIYMNKSFFTGRPVESMSKLRLRPGDRYDPWDSETLRLLGDKLNISPKKAQTLIRGYTAAIGMGVLALSDLMVRNIADFPERPSVDIGDYPAIGRFVKGNVSRYTKHMSKFYDLYNEVDELVATVNNYKRIGEFEKANKLAKANRKKLSLRKGLGSARKQLGDISLEMRKTWYSRTLTSEQKYERLQKLTERRNEIVKKIYDKYQEK